MRCQITLVLDNSVLETVILFVSSAIEGHVGLSYGRLIAFELSRELSIMKCNLVADAISVILVWIVFEILSIRSFYRPVFVKLSTDSRCRFRIYIGIELL